MVIIVDIGADESQSIFFFKDLITDQNPKEPGLGFCMDCSVRAFSQIAGQTNLDKGSHLTTLLPTSRHEVVKCIDSLIGENIVKIAFTISKKFFVSGYLAEFKKYDGRVLGTGSLPATDLTPNAQIHSC